VQHRKEKCPHVYLRSLGVNDLIERPHNTVTLNVSFSDVVHICATVLVYPLEVLLVSYVFLHSF
jgi:hypothetical protein